MGSSHNSRSDVVGRRFGNSDFVGFGFVESCIMAVGAHMHASLLKVSSDSILSYKLKKYHGWEAVNGITVKGHSMAQVCWLL